MRFPIDPLPPVGVTDDPYEIQEKAAITALRPVGARTLPPLIVPQRRPAPAPGRPPQQRVSDVERRAREERRQADRRTQNQPVTVDTRSGLDRRKGKRREDDPTTRVDLKA